MAKPRDPERRNYVKAVGGLVVGLAVGGAVGWLANPAKVEVMGPETTVTQTVTQTVTGTPTPTPTPTPTGKPFEGAKITVASISGGAEGAIVGAYYYYRDVIKQEAGIDIDVVEISFADLPIKIIADLSTGTGAYDTFTPCSSMMGDLVIPGYVHDVTNWIDDPRFPKWQPEAVPYAISQCSQWGGQWYGVPADSDAWYFNWNMKYMDPVLEDADKRAEFNGKFGYELDPYGWYKNRLWTWQKVRDVSEFFTGWDWNNDGEPDYGIVMGLRVGEQGPFWFYPFAAPFVTSYGPTKDRYHNVFWFDPETMDPLLKTPGFLEAATLFKDLLQFMPEAALTFTFADKWDYFLNKEKAMLLWAAPDTATLAGMPDQSKMRGYCMAMPGPGSEKYWDLENERWVEQINHVGNAAGCSWHGWVSTMSKNPEAAYWVLSYLSRPDNHRDITSSKMYWTGYDPGFISDVLTDYGGTATLADFNLPGGFEDPGHTTALYNEGDLRRFHLAVYNNFFAMDAVQDYMRLIGGTAMFTATDTHIIGEMMAGGESPETALDRTYNDWTKTIDDLDREKMKQWYQDMIGYGKPNPYVPQPWRFDDRVFPKDLTFS